MSPHAKRRNRKRDLGLIGLEVQLYLADRYNLSAPDTAIVFVHALADTIAYSLKPEGSIDRLLDVLVPELKRLAEFRAENPPAMTLRGMIAEYTRTGGKDRPN